MNKQKLILALCIVVLLVEVFAFFKPVQATIVDAVINGGFETGDDTAWADTGNMINDTVVYAGIYSWQLGYQDTMEQNFSTPIPQANITAFEFHAAGVDALGDQAGVFANIRYTDETETQLTFYVANYSYTTFDLLGNVAVGKTVKGIYFKSWRDYAVIVWLDSVSLLYDTTGGIVTKALSVSSTLTVAFTVNGTSYTTPQTLNLTSGNIYNLTVTDTYVFSGFTAYRFSYWLINGTTAYYTNTVYFLLGGDTNATLNYVSGSVPVIPPILAPMGSLSTTWFFRNDLHTTYDTTAYRLWEQNGETARIDTISLSGSHDISYGVRVWLLDRMNHTAELTSGSPVAIVTRTTNGAGVQSNTWTCPEYRYVVDVVKIGLYQRFDSGTWNLRGWFTTRTKLLYRFPTSTWTFYYTTAHTGSTSSTVGWGNSTYASYVSLYYYKADPFDTMTYHLNTGNFFQFIVTPWTYYLGSMFYAAGVAFLSGTMYLRYERTEPVIFMWWIFGVSGGVLGSVIPFDAVKVFWVVLALAMASTFYRLVR